MTHKEMIETLIEVNKDKKRQAEQEFLNCNTLVEGKVLYERIENLNNFLYQLEVTLMYM